MKTSILRDQRPEYHVLMLPYVTAILTRSFGYCDLTTLEQTRGTLLVPYD